MTPGYVVEIQTPKKVVLKGLWFGSKKPKRAIVLVHGLGASAFSMQSLVQTLVDKDTAVLTFNNRGHDVVAHVSRGKKGTRILAGAAHEIFTDCVDDIQGAINFAKRQGAKQIVLAGHSTGCQKSVYWASRTGGKGVKGIILLAPISDYSSDKRVRGKQLVRAVKAAKALLKKGKKHSFLDEGVWYQPFDAQRVVSLYSGNSTEEIFTYAQESVEPKTLIKVEKPLLVFLAQNDEYGDVPAKRMAEWFKEHVENPNDVVVVPRVTHGFRGGEKNVVRKVREWMKGL